jgi:hypothetical protein
MDAPVFSFDEVRRWPNGVLSLLADIGLVRETEATHMLPCDGCDHLLDVDVCEYPSGIIGVATCPECGRVEVPLDRLQQWEPNFAGLAKLIAASVGATGGVSIETPGRFAFLGIVQCEGRSADLFVGRGMTRPDAAVVLESSPRARASSFPAMLVPYLMPSSEQELPLRPATGALAELAQLKDKRLNIDLSSLWSRAVTPHHATGGSAWLSVTEAAQELMGVVSGIDLQKARARVSAAAGRDEFRTNGKTRGSRRIDRDSFSTWLMRQRDRDLEKADSGRW